MSEQNDAARPKKRAKKKNSLKHGVYSREIMLPGENIRDYEALAAEANEEWVPDGLTERSLVDRLVGLYWRKQRLDRYEHSKLQQRVQQIRQHNLYGRQLQEMKDLGPRFEDAATKDEVFEILDEISDAYGDYIEEKVPFQASEDAPPWGRAIAKYLASLRPNDQLEGTAKFIAIVDPDLIENDMARSDRIDEAIDRTIKRLMQVKTAKQIFPNMRNAKAELKVINVPAVTGPSPQANENEQNDELLGKVEVFAKLNPSSLAVPIDYNKAKLRIN